VTTRKPFTARLAESPIGIAIAVLFMFALMAWGTIRFVALIWGLIRLGIIKATSVAGLDCTIAPYIDLLSVLSFATLSLLFLKYSVLAKIPRVFLIEPVDIEEIESEGFENAVFPRASWDDLKAKVKAEDQIWLWRAPKYTWHLAVGGREGYVIVRGEKPTRHRLITRYRRIPSWWPFPWWPLR
jgi:hypothetical protein